MGRWIGEAGFRFDSLARAESAGTVWLAPAAGDGWAAAGDAAAAFDPLSSHGMTTALWTGAKAAEVALASLDGDRAALSAYAAKVAEGVHQFLLSRRRVYAAEERFADAPFWRRRHALAAATY